MCLSRGWFFSIMLPLLAASLPARSEPPPEKKQPVRLDRYGDPLPEGAVARLGTVRLRHGLSVSTVAFSPDGKNLASAGRPVGLCLWDAATGRPLHQLHNPRSVRSVCFAPDGKTILVSTNVTLLDVNTGRELRRFKEDGSYYESVAFSPDGRIVAAGEERARRGQTPNVIFWDRATGKKLRQLTGHTDTIRALAFSRDGKTLASSSQDETVRVWDAGTGTELHQLEGAKDYAQCLAFSPDGLILASPGKDNLIGLWDAKTGHKLRHLKGHEGVVYALVFSSDGKRLASGGRDRTIRLWDTGTWKELRRWEAHMLTVSALAFSPDAKTLASTGGVDHAIRLWDARTGKAIHPVAGHTGLVQFLRFSADGKTLLSRGGRDNKLLEWDVATSTERRHLFGGPAGRLLSMAELSPNGEILAAGGYVIGRERLDPIVHLWDTATGKELHALSKTGAVLLPLAFSPDGKLFATGSQGELCLWEVKTGKRLLDLQEHRGEVRSAVFSPDARTIASSGTDRMIRIWDAATGKQLRQWSTHYESLHTLVFSPDGRLLASFDANSVRVWQVATGKESRQFGGDGFALAFSPNGRILASHEAGTRTLASGDMIEEDAIRLWELVSGQEIQQIAGHPGYTWSLAFAPDGRTLASGGGDSTILLWDLTGRMKAGRLQPARLTSQEVNQLWTDLGGEASKAYRAVWTLVAAREQAVLLLKDRSRPAAAIDRRQLTELVANLDDKQFAVRAKAAEQLEKLGESAQPVLQKALAANPSAEVRRRVEQLLEKLHGPITNPELLRSHRALMVLAEIGTPEAQQVLKTLAQGAPEARLTQEAKAALERLAKRPNRGSPGGGR